MSKILVIDDELEICKQVSLILNKNSFKTSYVSSYDEYSKLKNTNFDFDLVLVDLWLKNSFKQGIDIINELKINFNNLAIISFSGHANIDNAIESVKAGANDFIEKPFETKKLLERKNTVDNELRERVERYAVVTRGIERSLRVRELVVRNGTRRCETQKQRWIGRADGIMRDGYDDDY